MILRLARQAGYSCSVKRCRQFSIRFDRPVEQFGEHHGGAGGCLASGDSGGIRAGATDGGSELASVVDQQLAHKEAGVSGVYNKAAYLRQRREMMQWYADYLDALSFSMTTEKRQEFTRSISE